MENEFSLPELNQAYGLINNSKLWTAIFHNAVEGLLITDEKGNILVVNNAFSSITGYLQNEVVGKNPRILKSGRHPQKFYEQMWESLSILSQWHGEIENRRKDGSIYPELLTILTIRNEAGLVTNYVGIFYDLTMLKDNEEFFKYIATHDQLTDLPNRARFYDNLNMAVYEAKLNHRQVAVFYIDLDGFKEVNDTYGHKLGDHLLIAIAERLLGCVEPQDTVARMGGDEFTVILTDIENIQKVIDTANRILSQLSSPFEADGHSLRVAASIGISLYPGEGADTENLDDVEVLLIQADKAMYVAKDNGGNTFKIFTK